MNQARNYELLRSYVRRDALNPANELLFLRDEMRETPRT